MDGEMARWALQVGEVGEGWDDDTGGELGEEGADA